MSCGYAGPAFADDAAPAGQAEAPAASSSTGDIVVTAQKREQSVQKVPISIGVISGETMQNFAPKDFKDVTKFVPNVIVQSSTFASSIFIRGFGSAPTNFGFDQSVSMYMDGAYAGRMRQVEGGPFFDLERVEVLRGPQGALFGKNTAAGAVSVVSANPTREWEGALTGRYYFERNGVELSGHVAGPLTETLGIRVAGRFLNETRGWVKNEYSGKRDPRTRLGLGRVTLRWEPADGIDYTVKASYADARVRGGLETSSPLNQPQQADNPIHYQTPSIFSALGRRNKTWLVAGTGNIEIGDHTLTAITGFSQFKSSSTGAGDKRFPGGIGYDLVSEFASLYGERFSQWSQELRVASPTGNKLEYIVGAYIDKSDYTADVAKHLVFGPLAYDGVVGSRFKQDAWSYSLFGQGTYHLTDKLRAIASLRYSSTTKTGDYNDRLIAGPYSAVKLNGHLHARIRNEGSLDPSFTLQYQITPDTMVYAVYGRGSKSGGFASNNFGTTPDNFAFAAEKSTNYEAGIKAALFDRSLRLHMQKARAVRALRLPRTRGVVV